MPGSRDRAGLERLPVALLRSYRDGLAGIGFLLVVVGVGSQLFPGDSEGTFAFLWSLVGTGAFLLLLSGGVTVLLRAIRARQTVAK